MRWQRLTSFDFHLSADGCAAGQRARASFVTAGCALAVAAVLAVSPVSAEEVIEGGDVVSERERPERGMPASNLRVKSILAAHPDEFVTICVAGCDDKPRIVQILPKPVERRSGSMRTSSGEMGGEGAPGQYDTMDRDAVTCMAGCDGRPGRVIQKLLLPPRPKKVSPPRDARAPAPSAHEAPTEPAPNEPLDVR